MDLVILALHFLQTSHVYYDLSIHSVFLTSLDIPLSNHRVILTGYTVLHFSRNILKILHLGISIKNNVSY